MSEFDRELIGYRLVEIEYGDTLQRIAFRELGDAARWVELVWINDLVHPYVTGAQGEAGKRVKLYGQTLLVPGAKPVASASIDPAEVFLADCKVRAGLLEADDGGDFLAVSGRENLKQQLTNAVITEKSSLIYYPKYGCSVRRLQGVINGPVAALMGEQYVKSTLRADFRVAEVTKTSAEVDGDRLSISAEVRPITGRPIDIKVV